MVVGGLVLLVVGGRTACVALELALPCPAVDSRSELKLTCLPAACFHELLTPGYSRYDARAGGPERRSVLWGKTPTLYSLKR